MLDHHPPPCVLKGSHTVLKGSQRFSLLKLSPVWDVVCPFGISLPLLLESAERGLPRHGKRSLLCVCVCEGGQPHTLHTRRSADRAWI